MSAALDPARARRVVWVLAGTAAIAGITASAFIDRFDRRKVLLALFAGSATPSPTGGAARRPAW
jgi:predicted MFS family arabinose efflux permease